MIKQRWLFFLMLLSLQGFHSTEDAYNHTRDEVVPSKSSAFPVPPQNEHSLFYVQRSKNTNSIIYETNPLPDGSLDPLDPIKIYWIRYATDGSKDELNYIQRKYAYGLDVATVKGRPGQYVLNFVSYSKMKIYLLKDASSHYKAYSTINGKLAELKRIFVSLNGGTFWFPKITDVEISGKDPATQKLVTEHFIP